MKKSIFMIACLLMSLLQAMQEGSTLRCKRSQPCNSNLVMQKGSTFFYKYKGTEIYVVAGCRRAVYEKDVRFDVVVVRNNEQTQLKTSASLGNGGIIGSEVKKRRNSDCIMKKERDSLSNKYHNNSTQSIKHRDNNVIDKDIPSSALGALKPRLSNPWHGRKRENYLYNNLQGEEAIKKALKDLELCYTIVLINGIKNIEKIEKRMCCNKENKSIAIPVLSVSTMFSIPRRHASRIALEAVIAYITNNEHNNAKRYSKIFLYVKKPVEYELYKSILMNFKYYWG